MDSVRVQLIQVVPTTHTPLLDWLLTGALVKNKCQYYINVLLIITSCYSSVLYRHNCESFVHYETDTFSHLFSHLFRRFLGRVDVSNHDEPAISICSTHWAYVVFFHILFYSVHPSQFRSAPGSGS